MTGDGFRPSVLLRVVLAAWSVLWFVGTPAVLIYLWVRSRGDPDYFRHLPERFGFHRRSDSSTVWVHAVSLGEIRSAEPIIRAFLDRGEVVVTTHFTPAGRREARRIFEKEIAEGRLRPVWVPLETRGAYRRFFRAFRPKFGLVMEVEFWPEMIFSSRRASIPLLLCNGQYPVKSFDRDRKRRVSPGILVPGFAGVMVKTEEQAARFRHFGVKRIAVTGEMRFDQPIPESLPARAALLRRLLGDRPVVGLTNIVADEEALATSAIEAAHSSSRSEGKDPPFFVFVPRAPERFGPAGTNLEKHGLHVARRSRAFHPDLSRVDGARVERADVLLGDSLGEMYFYLALCDRVVVGGGFTPAGSHNIIEALSLHKPVCVGPEVWTIEFPLREAVAAGVAKIVAPEELPEVCTGSWQVEEGAIAAFFRTYGGSVEKTLRALDDWSVHESPAPRAPGVRSSATPRS